MESRQGSHDESALKFIILASNNNGLIDALVNAKAQITSNMRIISQIDSLLGNISQLTVLHGLVSRDHCERHASNKS
eukprot:scaffold2914_cov156-Ochromonas_danica.AAC.9